MPRRKLGKGPDFFAKTVNLEFLNDNLGWGVVVRRNEFEVRVGAMNIEFGKR